MNVGIAGIGFMGMIHYLAWQRRAAGEGRRHLLAGRKEAGRRLARHSRQLRSARRDDGSHRHRRVPGN